MKLFKKILSTILLLAAIIAISLFKQYLVNDYPIIPFTGAGEDDVLMVNNAKSIFEGKWLGDYKYNTLKFFHPFFPQNRLIQQARVYNGHNTAYPGTAS